MPSSETVQQQQQHPPPTSLPCPKAGVDNRRSLQKTAKRHLRLTITSPELKSSLLFMRSVGPFIYSFWKAQDQGSAIGSSMQKLEMVSIPICILSSSQETPHPGLQPGTQFNKKKRGKTQQKDVYVAKFHSTYRSSRVVAEKRLSLSTLRTKRIQPHLDEFPGNLLRIDIIPTARLQVCICSCVQRLTVAIARLAMDMVREGWDPRAG